MALTFAMLIIAPASPASATGATPQTITPPTLPSTALVNQSFSLAATASSGLPVSVTVTGSPVTACSSLSAYEVLVERIGTCQIDFDQAGDSTYAPAPTVTLTMTITGAQQTITAAPLLRVPIGGSGQITATLSSGLQLRYAVIVNGIANCSVSPQGLVTGLVAGACNVLLSSPGTPTIAAALSVIQDVWITKRTQAPLAMTAPSTLTAGASGAVTVTGGSGTGLVSVTAAGDCSVSGTTVTANSSGTSCTVSAIKASDDQYEAASTSQTISISAASSGGSGSSGGSSGGGVTPGPVTSTDNSGDITFVLDKVATQLIKPSLDATDVFNSTGGQLVFTGRNLLSVQQVFVKDNLPVKIVKATDAVMTIELPKASLLGWQSLTLVTSGGKKVFTDSVRYVAPVVLKAITKTLTGFKVAQKALSKKQIVALKKFVKSVGKYKTVECRGLSSNATMTCKYVKKLYKAGRVKVTKLKIKATSPAAKQVRLVFTR
ncbi:MAG: hypothetical protein ORN27_08015 [Rhodoluna sp.]|nr:hypothetical protein [Rhodoluna sp.]